VALGERRAAWLQSASRSSSSRATRPWAAAGWSFAARC